MPEHNPTAADAMALAFADGDPKRLDKDEWYCTPYDLAYTALNALTDVGLVVVRADACRHSWEQCTVCPTQDRCRICDEHRPRGAA